MFPTAGGSISSRLQVSRGGRPSKSSQNVGGRGREAHENREVSGTPSLDTPSKSSACVQPVHTTSHDAVTETLSNIRLVRTLPPSRRPAGAGRGEVFRA